MTDDTLEAPEETALTGRRAIPTAMIVKAVTKEFDRTLPYWRCYADMGVNARGSRLRRPAVVSRTTQVLHRVPCVVFTGVDVVWASTRVLLRQPHGKLERGQYCHSDPEVRFTRYWRGLTFSEAEYTIDTLHFVHHDAHLKRSRGGEHSFHIQSVVLRDDPSSLQCVAGTMVSFVFLVFAMLRVVAADKGVSDITVSTPASGGGQHAGDAPSTATKETSSSNGARQQKQKQGQQQRLQESTEAAHLRRMYCPPPTSRILILGMGGNSMVPCLRAFLGPEAVIHVVEIEPAVVEVCRRAGTLESIDAQHAQTHVHLQEASAFLRSPAGAALEGTLDMVFMDVFEPMHAKMDSSQSLVHLCARTLRPGGLLVVNDHQLPSAAGLEPFADLFGPANVQAVNLRGWNESVIVGVRPGEPSTDGLSAHCTRSIAARVYDVYDVVRPGWMPHPTWLGKAVTLSKLRGCRVWES